MPDSLDGFPPTVAWGVSPWWRSGQPTAASTDVISMGRVASRDVEHAAAVDGW